MNFMKIESSNLSNGKGWRVVLWCSGCIHACPGCQNPETWSVKAGRKFTEKDMEKLLELLGHPYIRGLTLSGGDPLIPENRGDIADILRKVTETYPEKDIWCYTGYDYDDVKNLDALQYIDVLIDGKYVQELRDVSLPFRGSSNQRLVNVKRSKKEGRVIEYDPDSERKVYYYG